MDEIDKKIIGNRKHLYDDTIKYDEIKDWLSYDLKFDEFELSLKGCVRNHIISERDYKTLLAKYGWLYD